MRPGARSSSVENVLARRAALRVQMSMTPEPILIRSVAAANAAIGTTASRTRRLSACHTASKPVRLGALRTSSMPVRMSWASCRYKATGKSVGSAIGSSWHTPSGAGRGRRRVAAVSEATHSIRPPEPRWTHVALRVGDVDRSIAWYEDLTPLRLLDHHSDDFGHGAWLGQPDTVDKPFVLVLAQFLPDADPYRDSPLATLSPFAHLGIELPTCDGGR